MHFFTLTVFLIFILVGTSSLYSQETSPLVGGGYRTNNNNNNSNSFNMNSAPTSTRSSGGSYDAYAFANNSQVNLFSFFITEYSFELISQYNHQMAFFFICMRDIIVGAKCSKCSSRS